MLLSENQVFIISGVFFAVVAAVGFWFATMARRAGEEMPSDTRHDEQVKRRLDEFDEDLKSRLREVDAHVAQAHAQINQQVGSVR